MTTTDDQTDAFGVTRFGHGSITPKLDPPREACRNLQYWKLRGLARRDCGPAQIGPVPGGNRDAVGRLPQACRTCPDDGLGAVGDVQLGQDVGDMVAHRLRGQRKSSGNRCVVLSSRNHG